MALEPMLDFLEPIVALIGSDTILLLVGLLILIYTVITGVPPMPTHRRVVPVMFEMVPKEWTPRVAYDLGCGWGQLAFRLATRFPDTKVIGIELSPLPWAFCKLRQVVQRRPNLEIHYGDFLKRPLGDADLILCYLMINPMKRLQAKLDREARDGTVVISNSFALPDWLAEDIQIVPAAMSAWIYRYRIAADGSHHQVSSAKP
jgi:predicted RNA methylase